jgi:parallel beta-helix repeat protein
MRKKNVDFFLLLFSLLIFFANASAKDYSIKSFGAKADGVTNNAAFIQKAIDKASGNGGGRVIIPAGNFASGTIVLKSGVELYLELGARLLGSVKRSDYSDNIALALIAAKDQKNISITGEGTIDGQAPELIKDLFKMLKDGTVKDPQWEFKRPTEASRPKLIELINCTNVNVKDVSVKNAANWVQNYVKCTGLNIINIKVESTTYWNNDGIDITDSKNVLVENCNVNASDDGICLKSEDSNDFCDNITIKDCTVRSSASAFKMGTASKGGFKNIIVRNLTVYDTYRSAAAIEMVDGGVLENINIEKVTAKNTGNAIFIRLGHRNTDGKVGVLKGVRIVDLKAEIPLRKPDLGYPFEGPPDYLRYRYQQSVNKRPNIGYPFVGQPVYPYNLLPSSIVGVPGYYIEDVYLENIEIIFDGGGSRSVANIPLDELSKVPEKEDNYPEFSMFGELPAWGFYVRHASGIKMKNITLKFNEDDYRSALVFDDAKQIDLNGVNILTAKELPIILFNKVENKSIRNIKFPSGSEGNIKEQ